MDGPPTRRRGVARAAGIRPARAGTGVSLAARHAVFRAPRSNATKGGSSTGTPIRELAWVAEPTSPYHEQPVETLSALVDRISAVRGSPVKCYGSMDLWLRDKRGKPRRILQADQSVYLHPNRGRCCRVSLPWCSATTTCPTWCWRWTTRRTFAGASSGSTRSGASPRCGWRSRTRARRAAPGGACPD